MSDQRNLRNTMRVYHRYLGFFLAGIMAMYAVSGVILIFRNVGFLKEEVREVRTLGPGLSEKEVGEAIKVRDLRFEEAEGDRRSFPQGTYDTRTGEVDFTSERYPFLIDKLTRMHKANTKSPLFYLNIFFGVALLFFVVSSFWMFMPGTDIFRKGLYFVLAGIVLTLVMLFV